MKNNFTEAQTAWLSALRSGVYQQTRGTLARKETNREGDLIPSAPLCFCCLGVASELWLSRKPLGIPAEYDGLPCVEYDYEYTGIDEDTGEEHPAQARYEAPMPIVEKLNLRGELGELSYRFNLDEEDGEPGSSISCLAELNDSGEFSFREIAAFIEAYPWQVFKNFDEPEDHPFLYRGTPFPKIAYLTKTQLIGEN